ncbi:radical SAM family heme chaperone HemW [Tenacibaculum sp. SG-28]|uniref:radical SAM family heme chaperone HemW n=1 Tax=Tenacibaculum sp. SG-28 TaxID=754426 RepID=UPI000CF49C0E|nr:radical SAM family heme chaperone HemW [Tenacibaculum sp. SG-28]PQJ22835.1 coproporphyrinogen III oxidase [Tenacibaculum sp. SG-28]
MAGIYLHIPFCKQACHYCDFHFSTSLKKKELLISCLEKELVMRNTELKDESVTTIYFGGGTPSLLSVSEIKSILEKIQKYYHVTDTAEITLEANPDDLSRETLQKLATSKVNRLSIGVQSFFDEDLQVMNRAHSAKEALESLKLATKLFDNVTIDLIYGIPKMSKKRWKENLQYAFDLNINHISSYALTVEPKTALATFVKNGSYPNTNEDETKAHFDILVEETKKNGFVHYEISNFGKPGFFSKHNTSYWQGKRYIGIGPSAHSFNKTHRSWNLASNPKYIKAIQENQLPFEIEKLTKKDQFNEYLMTGLRTIWGVSLHKIKKEFGTKIENELLVNSKKYIENGLLQMEYISEEEAKSSCLKTTEKGKFLADGIASDLFII